MMKTEEFDLVIIGGGVSGQLAKRFFGSKYKTAIVGKGNRSNTALFRSKSADIPLMLGANAKEIFVSKFISSGGFVRQNITPRDMNRYSLKVCGKICRRSICEVDAAQHKRFVFDVPHGVDFESAVSDIKTEGRKTHLLCDDGTTLIASKVISTIPMPDILEIVDVECVEPEFEFSEITVAKFSLGCQVSGDWQQTVYFPDDDCHVYRATLNNDGIIAEFVDGTSDDIVKQEIMIVAAPFGIKQNNIVGRKIHFMKHGKIINGKANKDRMVVISHLTEKFNTYSLGRYATWNESVKTEDLLHDLKKIDLMMSMTDDEKKYNLRMVAR